MNAAPPVFHAQPSSDAVQPDAPASAASAATRAGSQDFAAALSDAGGKPVRKSTANKQQDRATNGSSLPAPGNQPPPAVTPPPQPTAASLAGAAAAATSDAAGKVKGTQGSQPDAIAAGSTAPASVGGATGISTSPNLVPAAPQGPAVQAALPAPLDSATGVDATAPSTIDPPATGSGMTIPHAVSMRTLAVPGTSSAAAAPKLPAGNASTASPGDATAKQGTTASANAAPLSNDANALSDSAQNNGAASGTGTDAAAQVVMAAAIAQGNSPVPDSASTNDFLGSNSDLPSGAAAVSGPSAGTPVAGAAAPGAAAAVLAQASAAAISAATTAATAASIAQAVLAAASTSAADKRSHGNGPDSMLPGASNDGSAGAAQLLTSNTATDNAPTPTFRVAAGVDTAQFGQGVADRVSMMMDGNLTSAKLQVNPPALGPIEVRIALQGGHAQISFLSHSAVTRDALESSSANLKDMLGSQGFSSVSVDISQRSFQEHSPQSQAYESPPSHLGNVPVLAQAPVSMSRSVSGLLDAYA